MKDGYRQVDIKCGVRSSKDYRQELIELARGKDVLNVGALGDVFRFLPEQRQDWLHHKFTEVSRSADGLDIDQRGIEHARSHGYNIISGDCTSVHLEKTYDLIVLYEVIEHLDAPVTALKNLVSYLRPNGSLILTTPNPQTLPYAVSAFLNRRPNVYWDHMSSFMPENIQALCDRANFSLSEIVFFSAIDIRGGKVALKSKIVRAAGTLSPRLHTNFAAVIAPTA